MPEVSANGARLHYTDTGGSGEVVVFSHSFLTDSRQYAHQIDALSERFRVIAYDHRGHGRSGHCRDPFTMAEIYQDGLCILDALGLPPVHWVGLSTGGFVGQRIAIREPDRLRSLVLMDTSAEQEPTVNWMKYKAMFMTLRLAGFGPVMGAGMKAMFGPSFLRDPEHAELRALWRERIQATDIPSLIQFGNAIFGRESVLDALQSVRCPTLVLVGADDRATPPAKARRIADQIPGARLEVIANAGHISTVEQPEAVTALLRTFLEACAG
jgi:3-oxoadipate enol-lactonase